MTWTSNASLPDLAAWLAGKRRIAILTHAKPDGDAFGSTIALARALRLATAAPGQWSSSPAIAQPFFAGPLPDWVRTLANPHEYTHLNTTAQPDATHLGGEPDAICILDTGSWSQLKEVEPWLRPRTNLAAIVDHHRRGDADVAPRRHIDPESAAACQLVAELCRLILNKPRVDELPSEIATPLYLGLATDTGWFHHSNVGPVVMHLAGGLLAAGVEHTTLFEAVERQDRPARLRLMSRALNSLQLLDHDRVAIMTLTQQDFHDCHAAQTDSGGLVDLPLSVASVQVSCIVTQMFVPPPTGSDAASEITKVSFRSKAGTVDVNAIASTLGGGGHIQAAGAKLEAPLADVVARVTKALLA
jgi:bifunctional oligoribonuclease and PAP phosphatase NrnA